MAPISEQRPPNTPLAQPAHTRSSSFFSFRKNTGDGPQRSLSLLGKSQSNGGPGTLTPFQTQNPQQPLGQELARTVSGPPHQQQGPPQPQPSPVLHPEIRSIVQLTAAHAHKIYYSGPLIRRIERQPDGQRPAKDEGWTDVWAQLGGTTLSIWDMKQVQEASQKGTEVPPTYVNMTDAFVQVLGSVTVPATASAPAKRYTDVLTLNTAGSNLLLFACPSTAALICWAAALRLSAWEKARLEEIYTAHLIRMTLTGADIATTLIRGRMEGWTRIRVAGQTDWKKVWMVISSGNPEQGQDAMNGAGKKKRMSTLFSSRDQSPTHGGPSIPSLSMYASPKPKDKKKPLLTLTNVTQAFAVYPERPELISRSTLIKVEGLMGSEDTAAAMRGREGWLLVMPELEGGLGQSAEMLKWVVGMHDAFQLYGRPRAWTWDPRESSSLMFAYPVGPNKDALFLDREVAESLDPREERTSAIRARLISILTQRMQGMPPPPPSARGTLSPPNAGPPNGQSSSPPSSASNGFQLPPLSFDSSRDPPIDRSLSPITERSSVHTHGGRVMSTEGAPKQPSLQVVGPTPEEPTIPEEGVFGNSFSQSPIHSPNLSGPPIPDKDEYNVPQSHNGSLGRPSIDAQSDNNSLRSGNNQTFPSNVSLPGSVSPPSRTTTTSPRQTFESPRATSPSQTSPHSVEHSTAHTLTSPYSPASSLRPSISASQSFASGAGNTTVSTTVAPSSHVEMFSSEAGALYYMQFDEAKKEPAVKETQLNEDSSSDAQSLVKSTSNASIDSSRTRPIRVVGLPKDPEQGSPTNRQGLGRKPSGARAQATNRGFAADPRLASHHQPVDEVEEHESPQPETMSSSPPLAPKPTSPAEDHNLDALAALSYLDVNDDQLPTAKPRSVEPLRPRPVADARAVSPSPPASLSDRSQFKSSFAPSKQVEQRKAKAQAQQAAQQAAAQRPGRANGRRKLRAVNKDAWNESSDEEEDDEEDDDDDDDEPVDSDSTRNRRGAPAQNVQPPAEGPPVPAPSHLRPPRTLPQIPGTRADENHQPFRRQPSDQTYPEAGRRTYYEDGTPIRTQAEYPQPGAARQSMWSQVLDPAHNPGVEPANTRDTFVQLEPQSHTMTKAFTPQGLLSAGLQDKQDRSAKRQEELARESGASLINVPNKPPPPQTGLLGAITAHERERKRDGGVGAALTEREREKRVAEERQRRFDEQQRQQLDQMQQGGSMYGYNPMMNPMMMGMGMNPMMNPMMTGGGMAPMMTGQGMSPMMTGQGMNPMMSGFPGMMGGYNPQHMFAAQQAAQAYQQAMMAFSVAGSQVGGEGGNGGGTPPLNPMMTGNMGGFDPRMSMMGMPMMSPMGGPMPMQMTGMSNFDPRFGPNNMTQMNDSNANLPPPAPGQFNSNSSSPVGRGSPLARNHDTIDSPRSRPGTPLAKPPS